MCYPLDDSTIVSQVLYQPFQWCLDYPFIGISGRLYELNIGEQATALPPFQRSGLGRCEQDIRFLLVSDALQYKLTSSAHYNAKHPIHP